MHKYLKKLIAVALVLTMLPFGSIVAMSESDTATGTDVVTSENDTDSAADGEGDSAAAEDTEAKKDEEVDETLLAPITDEEGIATCEVAAENDRFIMYFDAEQERVCVYDKENDHYWWSTALNAEADASVKSPQRLNQKSNLILKSVTLENKASALDMYSFKNSTDLGRTRAAKINNGVKLTFSFSGGLFIVPVTFTLNGDGESFSVAIDTTEIKEENISVVDGQIITALQLTPMFGAATNEEDGYIIVPDGSGAVIEFNNGKQNYAVYSQQLYGRDLTIVPEKAPIVTETASLPTMSIVSGENALVSIVTKGAGAATAKANVSFQSNSCYNRAFYEFQMRGTDKYYLPGDASAISVYEKGEIKIPKIEVTYYPVKAKDGDEVSYAECAEVVRDYLVKQGLTKKTQADSYDLYIDMFGGVMKQESIIGIPVNIKTEMTGFNDAVDIVSQLKALGVSDMVVNYNDWTNNEIKGKISTTAKASGTLGGNGDFEEMMSSFAADGIEFYPGYNNIEFSKSSLAFFSLTDTAIRVSNAYSRQLRYSRAYGIELAGVSPSLLAPSAYEDVFDKIVKNLSKKNISSVSFGDYANTLVSDYAKSSYSSRDITIDTLIAGYKQANEKLGSVLGDTPNDYLIPYVDHIINVPLSSSGFNITDYDIPFYQLVLHGYVPYSTRPMNEAADPDELFLLSIASGSAVHYDFIYEDASEVADTDYNVLFYANYKGWINAAAAEYKLASEVLGPVSDQVITNYEIDGDVITTTYENGYQTVVDLETGSIMVDGRTYVLSDYDTERR